MRIAMNLRKQRKKASRDKILEAAGVRLRTEGIDGAGVARVMKDAGLTHGGFYAHFKNKADLLHAAMTHSLLQNRKLWTERASTISWPKRIVSLARRYLTTAHRDTLENSCSLAALASEACRADEQFRRTYQQELKKSLSSICQQDFDTVDNNQQQETLALMALLIGGITLSRAVNDEQLSKQVLKACRKASAGIAV